MTRKTVRHSGPQTCGCYVLESKQVSEDNWQVMQTHVMSLMDPNDGTSFVKALLALLSLRKSDHDRHDPPSEYRIWKDPFYVSHGADGMGFLELRDHTIRLLNLFSATHIIFGVWAFTGDVAIRVPLIEGEGLTSRALREGIAAGLEIAVRDVVIYPHFSSDMVSGSPFAVSRIRFPNEKATPQEHDLPKL